MSTKPPLLDAVTEECVHRLEGHKTNAEYLADKGWRCPYCNAGEINIVRTGGGHVTKANVSNTAIRRLVRCLKCDKDYWDVYQLSGWSEHTRGDELDRDFQ